VFNVILVDDDKWAITDMRKNFAFAAHGFKLVGEYYCAEDAQDAISLLQPDLVITDICMKQKSGLDLVRLCRENHSDTLFIVISGYDNFKYAQEAISHGVFYYLLKPIDDTEAQEVLRRAYLHLSEIKKDIVGDMDVKDTFDYILEYVRTHYADQLSLEELADRFFINKNYLSELFSKRIGVSFVQYKNTLRLTQAKRMLVESNRSINEIAAMVGFEETGYFFRLFKQTNGITPLQFRMLKKT